MFLEKVGSGLVSDIRYPAIPPYPKDVNPVLIEIGNQQSNLVSIEDKIKTFNVYNTLELPKREELKLREEVLSKLLRAQADLPRGFEFVILDAHRTRDFQEELVAYYNRMYPELTAGYVSDPSLSNLALPHVTGGVFDITLMFNGKPLALGTDYDSFENIASIDALELTDPNGTENQLRRILYYVLIKNGFAPYPLEWWHWSYGDQWWAGFYGLNKSIYSEIS